MTTDRNHVFNTASNLRNPGLQVDAPNEIWAGGISYAGRYSLVVLKARVSFDSAIEMPSKPRATGLKLGDPLLNFEASRDSRLELLRVRAKSNALRGRMSSLDAQMSALTELSEAFVQRYRSEKGLAEKMIDSRYAEALASRTAAEATLDLLSARRERTKGLADRQIVAPSEIQDLEFEIARAAAEVTKAEAVMSRLQAEAEGVRDHGLSGDGSTDAPYLIQRLDEINIRLVELKAERASVFSEFASLAQIVAEIESTLENVDRFNPRAPADGLVWRPSPGANATLVGGEEAMQVLDCSRRFVEVTFRERHFGQIRQGSVAHVQLKGSDTFFTAPISSLRGAGNDEDEQRLSAIERARSSPDLTLYIDMPAPDPAEPEIASAFCDVGRTAEVRIQRQTTLQLNYQMARLFGRECETPTVPVGETIAEDTGNTADAQPTDG